MRAVAAVAPACVLAMFGLAAPHAAAGTTEPTPAACTITWDGGGGDNSWHTAANWSGDRLPGESDHVCLDSWDPISHSESTSTTIRSLRSTGRIILSAGVIKLTDSEQASALSDFTLAGGTFDATGELTVSGEGAWSSGTFVGATKFLPNARVDVLGDGFKAFSPMLVNEGTLRWVGAGFPNFFTGPVLRNSGRFVILGDGDPNPMVRSNEMFDGTIVNTGTVRLDDENGTLFVMGLENDGIVDVAAGEFLAFATSGPVTGSEGAFTVAAGATFGFDVVISGELHRLNAGATFTGGGTVRISGSVEVTGDVTVGDGTLIKVVEGGQLHVPGGGAIRATGRTSGRLVNESLIDSYLSGTGMAEITVPLENRGGVFGFGEGGTLVFGHVSNNGGLVVDENVAVRIDGDYHQSPDGGLWVDMNDTSGSSARVVVSGRATLAGTIGLGGVDPTREAEVLAYASRVGEFASVIAPADEGAYFLRYGANKTTVFFVPGGDTTRPTNPTIRSDTHRIGVPSSARSIRLSWTGAFDAQSEVDGFSYEWSSSSTSVPDTIKDAEHEAAGTTSPPLADGTWYFHLRTRDNAGNWSHPFAAGPFRIDTVPPETQIVTAPRRRTKNPMAAFRFRSTESGSTFQCKRDLRPWVTCTSPKLYGPLKKGLHRFRVRAADMAGNVDPTPALRIWRIV